ncbi:Spx/MgsR family RNA polymerase-binding regulatory protein [Corallococcus sp. Z5C101001]|uniref:Spx/MgsR family RNA polymerase-binding regulatory protein n=1 Tax=Corallococcus sp. Z5C101001 TaxID=2596829 RepID=UPI00117F5359|nr:Spx/MgsR family RNA polymerase-binding regulatory protein [Corallococcus sp. Z5C101001]TSC23535.1 Spx/MgsR family RNA polymerase-binding regulatory protein [Corallococcus sp. Z5C101001]
MADDILVLAYSGCDTCKKALKWLEARGVSYQTRPIVDQPPTVAELRQWIPKSGVSVRKWLNTSGQSYRALGKEQIDAASDEELVEWLSKDGKLVKRPVLISKEAVTVGFRPEAYDARFPPRG